MYYPKSQIKTNLYTNGYEFTTTPTNTTNSYSGYYWKTSNGKYFTGKTPQDLPTQPVILQDLAPPLTPPGDYPAALALGH
jgi:hypothetical protein